VTAATTGSFLLVYPIFGDHQVILDGVAERSSSARGSTHRAIHAESATRRGDEK
jgi:hypothetical protein